MCLALMVNAVLPGGHGPLLLSLPSPSFCASSSISLWVLQHSALLWHGEKSHLRPGTAQYCSYLRTASSTPSGMLFSSISLEILKSSSLQDTITSSNSRAAAALLPTDHCRVC